MVETSPGNKGGDLKFSRYKRNIENLLKKETDIIITSLIDFFRLKNDFPGYNECQGITDKKAKVRFLENAIKEQINDNRFLPYIQLHEFEGLLFSDIRGIEYIPNIPPSNIKLLERTIADHPDPELLNDGHETAPSKRLKKLIPGYQKTLHGPLIAEEIGISVLCEKCPRFSQWVQQLVMAINN